MNLFFSKKNLNKKWLFLTIPFLMFTFIFPSCDEEPAIAPKPRGYPKVDYPTKAYHPFEEGYCEFSFEYPKYAKIEKDEAFFGERPRNECWFDIFIPQFDARIHCTYSEVDQKKYTVEKLKADAFELAHKHNIKAKYIEEIKIDTRNGAKGFAFDLEGAVASPFQFFLTDEKRHFMRGSLYFNTEVAPDSLAPIFTFVKKDIEHMINTLEWNEKR